MKKCAAVAAAAVAVLALSALSGVALAGDHHGDHGSKHGQKPASPDQQAGVKPSNDTSKDQTCTAGGGQGGLATCQSGTYPGKPDASKRYGNGKTAAQIANGKGAPAGTPIYGPGNSQPHKICGRDVHAYKGGDCSTQKPPKPPKQETSQQQITFCDMDSPTTGDLQTKNATDLLNHEFDGSPEETRDIVPPFTFAGPTFTTKDGRTYVAGQSYSQLWNATTEAIFKAGCHGSAPTPPPTTTTNPAPQTVTFCDMDTATTGKLETKPVAEILHHEMNGTPEEARDIIPPFTYNGQTYSQLWNAQSEAIFNAHCNLATTSAAVTPAARTPAPAAQTPAPAAQTPAPAAQTPAPVAQAQAPAANSGVLGASKALTAPAATPSHAKGAVLGSLKALGSTATSGTLPFTGLRLWIVELIALGLIGSGVALRLIARRRTN